MTEMVDMLSSIFGKSGKKKNEVTGPENVVFGKRPGEIKMLNLNL